MEEQEFTIVKEKIIKTNELLSLYNEKNEKLFKATNAFKQVKSKYEAALHETNRLKMDNDRLNYRLEAIIPKYEQCEKDLNELRADYTRTDERYQQTMIDSQLTISDLEEKVKYCTCEKSLDLSPSKKNNSNEKVKEFKRMCIELKEVENILKTKNDSLQLKNKELKEERLSNLKVIEDFTAKNVSLQRDVSAVKKKLQQMELASKNQANLQLSIASIKQNHEKQIHSLKMEISKLSLDNKRIKYLELECENLKQQINSAKSFKVEKTDCCVQTKENSYGHNTNSDDSLNIQKIKTLEKQHEELKLKLMYFESNISSKRDIGVQAIINESIETSKMWENDFLDCEYSVHDILTEMIVPKAVSPLSFSTRSLESPIPPSLSMFEPFCSSDAVLSPQESFVQKSIPNIIITPPTPGVEKGSHSNVIFPLLAESVGNQKQFSENVDEAQSIVKDVVPVENSKKDMSNGNINSFQISHPNSDDIMEPPHDQTKRSQTIGISSNDKEEIALLDDSTVTENIIESKTSAVIDTRDGPQKYSNEHDLFIKSTNSVTSDTSENLLENQISEQKGISFISPDPTSRPENISNEEVANFKSSTNFQKYSLKDKFQRRRKFWVPINMSSFVKLRRKRIPVKTAKVTKKDTNQSSQNDTILNALRTLQQNNINFTISNESIPLIHPYNCYSLLTPPKTEPSTNSRKFTNPFSYSLDLNCWNKQCNLKNTQMLLRNVPNEEEPELLGFFSIKNEVITPSASRMAVLEQPKPIDTRNFITQLLNGIKELVNVQRRKSTKNKRKKRSKSTNRRSDFYSETETELEKLFRKSADILGRNKRFLAAAKEQNFDSTEESMFGSEYDAMVDSGLVTGTPKIDTDNSSFCNQVDLGKHEGSDFFKPIRNGQNTTQDNILQSPTKDSIVHVKDHESFVGFSSSTSAIVKSVDVFKNETPFRVRNSATPKFSTCPDMLSPIASSKGSPETLHVLSTPFKTPEYNSNPQTSPECFKIPFCPIMISPMASSQGSPVSQASVAAKIKDVSENSLDCFKIPFGPSMVNRLVSSAKSKDFFGKLGITDYSKNSSNHYNDIKSSCSKNEKSSVCQKISFEYVSNNEYTTRSLDLPNIELEDTQELLKISKCSSSNFQSLAKTNKDDNRVSADTITPQGKLEHIAESCVDIHSIEKKRLDHVQENKLSFSPDLSFKSSDLNYTLDDISISQLEISCTKPSNVDELNKGLDKKKQGKSNSPKIEQACKPTNKKCSKETSYVENSYSLRRKSHCIGKHYDFKLESLKAISPMTEKYLDFISPRTRAAKRKMMDELKSNEKEENIGIKSANAQELTELVKRKRGRPPKVGNTPSPAADKKLNDSEPLVKSTIKTTVDTKEDTLEKNPEKESGDVDNVNNKNLIGSDSVERADLITERSDVLKSDYVNVSEDSAGKGQQKKIKKLLKNRRKSNISNKDISNDLVDWELQGVSDTDSKKGLDNFIQIPRNLVKWTNQEIISVSTVPDGVVYGNDMEMSFFKKTESPRKSKKIVSKEFISESESECDVSSKPRRKEQLQESVGKPFQNTPCNRVQRQSNSEDIQRQSSDLEKNEIELIKKNESGETENVVENKETLGSNIDPKSHVQNNYTNNQIMTSEIQSMLRSLTEEQKPTQTISLLDDFDRNQKDENPEGFSSGSCSTEQYLFGDVSESEEETSCSSNKDCKIAHKVRPKKVTSKHNLRKKMLNQVRGMIYAYSKNKDCDIGNSCENKPLELPGRSISEENSSSNLLTVKNESNKINIVQNILISNGQTINLLSSDDRAKEPSSTASSSEDVEDVKPTPPSKGEKSTIVSGKRIKVEQNISNFSTPVDILSQVMQGMVKTGPKAARKNTTNHPSYLSASRGRQPNFIQGGIVGQRNITREQFKKPWKSDEKVSKDNNVEVDKVVDEFLECPKSPDVLEMPDRLPRLIPTQKPVKLGPSKVRALIDKLMVFSNETKMLDDVIREFAFQDMTFVVEIIIDKLSQDYHDKADNSLPPSPPMTSTQRILLGFLLRLDKSTHPGIKEKFLSLAELQVFNRKKCTLEIVQPITRLYTALCKLVYDLNRIRRFICDGFYFMGDLAVPLFFTVLTMWPDVLPMESNASDNLLVKAIIQICYLKQCNQPGYNFLPLRDLLTKFYGYPIERWNCEEIFKEILVEYIRNPSIRLSDFTLLLYLRNKPTKWVYQKMQEIIIPLYHQASDRNPNLKATLVILLANICCGLNQGEDYDWSVILAMDKWFLELDADGLDHIIKRSIHLARGRIPRRPRIRNKNKKAANEKAKVNKSNEDTSETTCERTQNCAVDLILLDTGQDNSEESSKKYVEPTISAEEAYSESTNNANVNFRLDDSRQTNCEDKIQNLDTNLSKEDSDSETSRSDIEF